MPAYYSDTVYNGPETIIVAMDIGTTQSALNLNSYGEPDPVFQVRHRSPTVAQAANLKRKWYSKCITTVFYLIID